MKQSIWNWINLKQVHNWFSKRPRWSYEYWEWRPCYAASRKFCGGDSTPQILRCKSQKHGMIRDLLCTEDGIHTRKFVAVEVDQHSTSAAEIFPSTADACAVVKSDVTPRRNFFKQISCFYYWRQGVKRKIKLDWISWLNLTLDINNWWKCNLWLLFNVFWDA